ncbi:MAG: hypothetical protein GXO04_05020 [Aquificae bacterium]|nr:hypothetical protein [Aquificota bacterium]
MRVLLWTPVLLKERAFPRKDGVPFIPSGYVRDAFLNALIYYAFKKDKVLERRVLEFLLEEDLSPKRAVEFVKESVLERHPEVGELEVSDAVLEEGVLRKARVVLYDLRYKAEVEVFDAELGTGAGSLDVSFPSPERLRSACHSFAEALLHAERTLVRGHPLEESFYVPLSGEIKRWEVPLRLGRWTDDELREKLFWFWGDKRVRERVRRLLGRDIRPARVFFYPREGKFLGWTEVRRDV